MSWWEVRAHTHVGGEVLSLPDKKRSGSHGFMPPHSLLLARVQVQLRPGVSLGVDLGYDSTQMANAGSPHTSRDVTQSSSDP